MDQAKSIELIHPDAPEFRRAIEVILGREPDDVLKPALPYSVIVRNNDARAIALLGIRFDMLGPKAKPYSVTHYADTLRHPEKADLRQGAMRFVCAEPLYTSLVLRGEREVDRRGPMNLQNLRTMLRVRATLDCVGFDDGQFAGPDSLGAFERLAKVREAELSLLEEVLRAGCVIESVLGRAMEIPAQSRDQGLLARRALGRWLHEGLTSAGAEEVAVRARDYRVRIPLRR